MPEWRDALKPEIRERLTRERMPRWTAPMLATLTDDRFSSSDWVFERKLDGERCLAFGRGGRVTLMSRNQQGLNDSYPEIVDALEAQSVENYIADGEIVAFEGGVSSFARLQQRIGIHDPKAARASGVKVFFYLFDLLHLGGYAMTELPLRERKSLLRKTMSYGAPLRFTTHRNETGERYFRDACERGWEGLIAKRADSSYVHGRSRQWLKFKCSKGQELVVCGYTDPQGTRIGFGALLLGYYEDRELRYAGKVGTGFDDATLESLRDRLEAQEQDRPPYAEVPRVGGAVHWVKPRLVAEIGFTEWTRDGRLRHPRFLGLRRDKKPSEVHRERPKSA